METCKITRQRCKYAPYNPDTDECHSCVFDTRAIKPEKYAELREQDFDTWLDTILHEIIEQVNFDASEVDALGGAVWNGECPDGTPYPKQCEREDAYIQCIRQSNQLDSLEKRVEDYDIVLATHAGKINNHTDALLEHEHRICDLESQITSLETQLTELKAFIGHTLADSAVDAHTGSNFCGNCKHYTPPASSVFLPLCSLLDNVVDPDDSSCAMFESNQLDNELLGKPDREECKHCPKAMCDNCMNYPF